MNSQGRPTQIHAVPPDERAPDDRGGFKPWAELYHEDHPKGRGQKRHVEEKGAFGKSTRRRGTSRTRTATPAKKENPTLDGFDRAWKTTIERSSELSQDSPPGRVQNESTTAPQKLPSHNKIPTQVFIYGYDPTSQWKAIDAYERISFGYFCEDYPRDPPAELQKIPKAFSSSTSVRTRTLTELERKLAFEWKGGRTWIRLTCDSAETADRVVFNSPQVVFGTYAYADIWQGKGPDLDEPILAMKTKAAASHENAQTLSAAFSQKAAHQYRAIVTFPRSFQPTNAPEHNPEHLNGHTSTSPSTVSSATAIESTHANLRSRISGQIEGSPSKPDAKDSANGSATSTVQYNSRMMRHFQDQPRTLLHPASEAFLPQPTWWERQLCWLRQCGLIPGDFIGDIMPVKDNGEFDWAAASWYWRFCKWIDDLIGSDICGLKDG